MAIHVHLDFLVQNLDTNNKCAFEYKSNCIYELVFFSLSLLLKTNQRISFRLCGRGERCHLSILWLGVIFNHSGFFSPVSISVATDSYPFTCLLLILKHRPSHTTGLRIPVSQMSKICVLQLADLPPQLSRSLQKELVLERKWSSHQKLSAMLEQ